MHSITSFFIYNIQYYVLAIVYFSTKKIVVKGKFGIRNELRILFRLFCGTGKPVPYVCNVDRVVTVRYRLAYTKRYFHLSLYFLIVHSAFNDDGGANACGYARYVSVGKTSLCNFHQVLQFLLLCGKCRALITLL